MDKKHGVAAVPQLDDYFDRLDAAFSKAPAASPAAPAAPAVDALPSAPAVAHGGDPDWFKKTGDADSSEPWHPPGPHADVVSDVVVSDVPASSASPQPGTHASFLLEESFAAVFSVDPVAGADPIVDLAPSADPAPRADAAPPTESPVSALWRWASARLWRYRTSTWRRSPTPRRRRWTQRRPGLTTLCLFRTRRLIRRSRQWPPRSRHPCPHWKSR